MKMNMRIVKNGKLYDTDTAEEIGSYCSTHDKGNFRGLEESLYRKKTGEFFLAGKGGPMTHYRTEVEPGHKCWTGGEGIIPLSIDEAKAWVERHLDADDYIELFGEVEE